MTEVKDRVRAAREAKGLTQGELGAKVDLSTSAISGIEKGISKNPDKIKQIAKVLSVSYEWLMHEEGEAPKGISAAPKPQASWKDEAYIKLERHNEQLTKQIEFMQNILDRLVPPGAANFLTALDNTAGAIVVELFPAGALSGAQVA